MSETQRTNHTVEKTLEETRRLRVPQEVENRLRGRLAGFHRNLDEYESRLQARRMTWVRPRPLAWMGGLGFVAILAGIALVALLPPPGKRFYAAAMEALKSVRTVHMSGWTTRIQPETSAAGDEPLDSNKRYPVDIWEWFAEDGRRRFYDHQGPFTVWDDGSRRYEYQAHHDRLSIRESDWKGPSYAERFQSMSNQLGGLTERGYKVADLGECRFGDRLAKGVRAEKRDGLRKDCWFDAESDLPLLLVRYDKSNEDWIQSWEISLAYDGVVPASIANYVPPETEQVHYASSIDPRLEKWHRRLSEIDAHYRTHPLPQTMELLPRKSDEEIPSYAPGSLPSITSATGHWVMGLQCALGDFVRTNMRPQGWTRVPEDILRVQLNHDLVTTNEDSPNERVEFVLNELGFEVAEATEERTVWVAHYDGRPLKDYKEVKAPVSSEGARATGPGMASSWGGCTMQYLFESFAYWQDMDLSARKIVIIDETGIPSGDPNSPDPNTCVSWDSPYWGGEESIDLARNWFQEEFGVTFTEEVHPMKINIVRRKQGVE